MTSLAVQNNTTSGTRSGFYAITRSGGAFILRPAGPRLGEREAGVIAADVKAEFGSGFGINSFVIDLSDVQIVSSYGLGLCIELRNWAKGKNLLTTLRGMSPEIRDVFRIMKVDRLFTIDLSQDGASRGQAA